MAEVRTARLRPGKAMFVTQILLTAVVLSGPALAYPGPLVFVAGTPVPRVVTSVAVTVLVVALAVARRTRLGGGYSPGGAASLGAVLLGVLLLVAAFLTWWGDNNDYIEVGRPSAASGCRAWVEESSFLFIGSGSSYSVGPWQPLAFPSGTWVVDDGYRPVRDGRYTPRPGVRMAVR
jgi:hypothetical protein